MSLVVKFSTPIFRRFACQMPLFTWKHIDCFFRETATPRINHLQRLRGRILLSLSTKDPSQIDSAGQADVRIALVLTAGEPVSLKIIYAERDPWGLKTKAQYEPFIDVFETNSVGERHRVRSRLTGRTHHYLSRGECAYHYVAELAPRVLDIREQYPIIPAKETLKIAKALKVQHPFRGSEPFEVTIDLMLSVDDRNGGVKYVARSVKPAAELEKADVQARLALECAACRARGIPWKLVTETLANAEVRSRGRWLFKVFKDFPDYTCDEKEAVAFIDALSTQKLAEPLREVISGTGKVCGLPYEEAINRFKYLVCTRRVRVDLSASLALKDPHPALAENFL